MELLYFLFHFITFVSVHCVLDLYRSLPHLEYFNKEGLVWNYLQRSRPIIPSDAPGYIYNNLQQTFTPFRSVFRAINPPYVSPSPSLPHSVS